MAVRLPGAKVKVIEASIERSNVPDLNTPDVESVFMAGKNKCIGAEVKLLNADCIHVAGPQAGANVTKGYVGGMDGKM